MIETIQADWIKSEAINLENCCNDNPLKILGPHSLQQFSRLIASDLIQSA